MQRNCSILVCGSNKKSYPSEDYDFDFFEMDELFIKIDECIESSGFHKVDVYLNNDGQFSEDEIELLKNQDIIIV
jgi:hypothetical protein